MYTVRGMGRIGHGRSVSVVCLSACMHVCAVCILHIFSLCTESPDRQVVVGWQTRGRERVDVSTFYFLLSAVCCLLSAVCCILSAVYYLYMFVYIYYTIRRIMHARGYCSGHKSKGLSCPLVILNYTLVSVMQMHDLTK